VITTFAEAKRLNRLVGQYWFLPDTMQFLGTVLGEVHAAPYGAYFSYTNADDEFLPQHKVAYINDQGYVNPSYSGEGSGHLSREEWEGLAVDQYDSAEEAAAAAKAMARKAWGRR
jgi:hypothetical protein